jgi:hypothetical protein
MEKLLSTFQQRFAFIVGGAILLDAGFRKRLTPIGFQVLAAMGGLLIRDAIIQQRSRKQS